MKHLQIFLTLIFCASFGYAQTNLSGSIFSSTTLSTAGSPYVVSGNLVVFDGAVLTIEPGVIVKFETNASLEMRGTLNAIGTAYAPIEFTSNLATPVKGSWNGIVVIGTTNPLGVGDQVTMKYVRGLYAKIFINLDIAYHGPYKFNDCYFAHNYAVNEDGGLPSVTFENCKFEYNDKGLSYCQFESIAKKCDFINNVNALEGIKKVDSCYFNGNTGIALSPYGSTNGCKVEYNNIGVSCYFNSANSVFTNNVVKNNQVGVEMLTFFNGSHQFTGNTICNNTNNNIKLLTPNNAHIPDNCWCTTDSSQIRSNINDGYVNNANGLVSFMPISNNCPGSPLAVNNIASKNETTITAHPNPFHQTLTFSASETGNFSVNLYDLTGRRIMHQTFSRSSQINTENLGAGLYIYEVLNKSNIIANGKVLKD